MMCITYPDIRMRTELSPEVLPGFVGGRRLVEVRVYRLSRGRREGISDRWPVLLR